MVKKKKIIKIYAYKKGANNLLKLSNYIFNNYDTKYISAFALSKNNLKRSKKKININKKSILIIFS